MRQQLLPIPPEQLLAHLRLELDLDRLEVLHPALWCDEGIVGAEQKSILRFISASSQSHFTMISYIFINDA